MLNTHSLQKKSFGILRISFVIVAVAISFFLIKSFETRAQDTETVTTTVTVGNSAPSFTVQPYEDPASTTTAPTAIGANVVFRATATDSNAESYYLLVCSTGSATATNGGAPTCAAGATTYCTSSLTASGTATSCSYATQSTNPFTNPWYAFVCDANAAVAACSSSSQGTASDGSESPFYVNHTPLFTAISTTPSPATVDPGASVKWDATASDPDVPGPISGTDPSAVRLLVCKTNAMSNGTCTGGAWCTSSATGVLDNPSCTYTVPGVSADGQFDAYVFIVDQYNVASISATQGTNSSFTINNIAPTVTNVTLNGGNDINLEEATTKAVSVTATVTDTNGCSTSEITNVYAYVYRSGITYNTCSAAPTSNPNNCYKGIACTQDAGSCNAGTGAATYTCTVNLQYYADPTDLNTQFPAQNWLASIQAIDDDGEDPVAHITTGVEVNSLVAFSVQDEINYGSLGVGEASDPLKTLVTTATGNVGLDQEHSGAANMCTDYPTCSGGTPIPVANQKYALSATTYALATALSTSAVEVELNIAKVTSATPTTGTTYWGISIPSGTVAGTYNGANTITAVKGEIANW